MVREIASGDVCLMQGDYTSYSADRNVEKPDLVKSLLPSPGVLHELFRTSGLLRRKAIYVMMGMSGNHQINIHSHLFYDLPDHCRALRSSPRQFRGDKVPSLPRWLGSLHCRNHQRLQ